MFSTYLGNTPAQSEDGFDAWFCALAQFSEARIDLMFWLLAHRAGVDQQQFRLAWSLYADPACGSEHPGDALGVMLAHLAAESLEVEGAFRLAHK